MQQSGQAAYQPEVRARFDILGFDPRGVGRSDPVTCFPTAAEEAAAFAGEPPYPVTAAEERGWPALADALAQLATASATKVRAKSTVRASQLLVEWNRRKEEYASIGTALQQCVEARHSGRPLAYPRYADAADKRAPHFGRMRLWVGQPCEFMGVRDQDAYLGPWKQTTKTPVMVIGTRYDPATPYEATRPYADHFPKASMLTVEGYGHTVLGKSTCADNLITTYLTTSQPPADGSTCGQDRKPFDPVAGKVKFFQTPN